jgi:hypothetical protein
MKAKMNKATNADVEKAGPYLVSLRVSFGPAFSDQKLNNRQFVEKLRAEAKQHPASFLSPMMDHFADHIEAAAADGSLSLAHEADTNPNVTYYGHGSCAGCPSDDGTGYPCCLCSYNGQNIGCESC